MFFTNKNTLWFTLCLVSVIGVILWEHSIRSYEKDVNEKITTKEMSYVCPWKPSVFLTTTYLYSRRYFEYIGSKIAIISSFTEYLRLTDLLESTEAVLNPFIKVVYSPFWTICGYAKQIETYSSPRIIISSSIFLLLIILGATYYFGQKYVKI